MKKINVIQVGLGPIGVSTARVILGKPGLSLVGAVDVNPQLIGKDLGEVLGLGNKLGAKVVSSLDEIQKKVDVAIHCTSSSLLAVRRQMEELFRRGINVVTSTEELLFPQLQHPGETKKLDALA